MKFIEEFQTPESVGPLIKALKRQVQPGGSYRFMEFCGGHTHSLFQTGLIDLLPREITMVHGPGCPVCVLPSYPIENSIALLEKNPSFVLATYGDLMRVPTSTGDSLLKAKGRGQKILSLYSPLDALEYAKKNPQKKVIFLAIGFETTIAPTTLVLDQAIREKVFNFSIYCNHLNTAYALQHILEKESNSRRQGGFFLLDGLIGPGHVALITGAHFFESFTKTFEKPIVISGFSPFDLAESLLMLVKQVNAGVFQTEVQYKRAVTGQGNRIAQEMMSRYLTFRTSFYWRGLGRMEKSAFRIKEAWKNWDAEYLYDLPERAGHDHPQCQCPKVLTGEKNPLDCKLFATACTPDHPLGACMVSSEGACSAYYLSGQHLNNKNLIMGGQGSLGE